MYFPFPGLLDFSRNHEAPCNIMGTSKVDKKTDNFENIAEKEVNENAEERNCNTKGFEY